MTWRAEPRPGKAKPAKTPYSPTTGRRASVTKPTTWGTYPQAAAAAAAGGYDGLGFVITGTDPFTVIDLDGCRDPHTGALEAWAQQVVDRFASYTEVSPSGTGVHIWVRGTLPPGGRRKGQVELYDRDRFLTFTGQALTDEQWVIRDRQAELRTWHREVFGDPDPYGFNPERVAEPAPSMSDQEVLDRVLAADNGAKVQRLYQGETSDHGGDHSRADLALVSLLAFWTQDAAQLDRLFRESALFRSKWDQRHGDQTYGERTVAKALATRTTAHNPHHGLPTGGGVHAATQEAEPLPTDVVALQAMVREAQARAAKAEARADLLTELESRKTRMGSNAALGQARLTAVALAARFGNRQAAGDPGDNGLHRISLASLAQLTAHSADTAGKHLAKLEQFGLVRRRVRWVPEEVDRETGEIIATHRATLVGPPAGMDALAFAEAVATYVPTTAKTWGGKARRAQAEDMPLPPVEVARHVNPQDAGLGKPARCTNIVLDTVGGVNPQDAGLHANPPPPPPPPPVSNPVVGSPPKPGLPPNPAQAEEEQQPQPDGHVNPNYLGLGAEHSGDVKHAKRVLPPNPPDPPPVSTPRLTLVPAESAPAIRLVRGQL